MISPITSLLFHRWFMLTTKKNRTYLVTGSVWLMTGGWPVAWNAFPCHHGENEKLLKQQLRHQLSFRNYTKLMDHWSMKIIAICIYIYCIRCTYTHRYDEELNQFKTWLLWLLHNFLTQSMMTSSNGNIFRVTGHLCGEFTGPRWIPHTKASDAELWCLLWSAPE